MYSSYTTNLVYTTNVELNLTAHKGCDTEKNISQRIFKLQFKVLIQNYLSRIMLCNQSLFNKKH